LLKIHSISFDMLHKDMMKLCSEETQQHEAELFEGDSLGTEFILEPLKIIGDTREFGDILVEWSREIDERGKIFTQVCWFPTPPVSIVNTPLTILINPISKNFWLAHPFKVVIIL